MSRGIGTFFITFVWVIFKLFDQSFNRFLCDILFNSGVWYAWDSEIDVAATLVLCLRFSLS